LCARAHEKLDWNNITIMVLYYRFLTIFLYACVFFPHNCCFNILLMLFLCRLALPIESHTTVDDIVTSVSEKESELYKSIVVLVRLTSSTYIAMYNHHESWLSENVWTGVVTRCQNLVCWGRLRFVIFYFSCAPTVSTIQ